MNRMVSSHDPDLRGKLPATIAVVLASLLCIFSSIPSLAQTISVTTSGGVAINAKDYGANNIWYLVPGTNFDTPGAGSGSYVSSLMSNAGVTYLRFPGGFESEHYQWTSGSPIFTGGPTWTVNTLDPNYKNYTSTPGATPKQAKDAMGKGNLSFVVRTEDVMQASSPSVADYENWATEAGKEVTSNCGTAKDWQIGNEWYNQVPAKTATQAQYQAYVEQYATIVFYYAQSMQDVHIYTGIAPGATNPGIAKVYPRIGNIKTGSGKSLVYVSEWAADLNDNNKYGGLENANIMMQLFGQMARAGIAQAAYWPPVMTSGDAQADTITLISNTSNATCDGTALQFYAADADGQAFKLLSGSYQGQSLATSSANTSTQAVAALNSSNQFVIFLMTNGSPLSETDVVNAVGSWSKVESAQVMLAGSGQSPSCGPVTINSVNTSAFTVNPGHSVTVPLNLGGAGGLWEIIQLVLGN